MSGLRDDLAARALALPIYRQRDEILEVFRAHRVMVLEGPTGCGKTTQLPRMLLRAGLSERTIGITQPRRIAAVSVASRIAQEEGVTLGQEVGYAIRFDDRTSARTRVKIMTDGILLQEVRSDPELNSYDVLVVDEAHERSLNIDFVLGLLYRLLERRQDLKVLVSSATIQPELFERFFEDIAGKVGRVTVNARVHPVREVYRPMPGGSPADMVEGVARAVVDIHQRGQPGHVLAFLTGEAMITRTQQAIEDAHLGSDLVVFPLFGRLSRDEQERVFDETPGQRKVVLATNIAETSITIDDVRYVIDTGLAKIPRFNPQSGMTSLREEPISLASAKQRAGRAGRTAPGEVIRLYRKDDYYARPDFTEEEIRRLDLSEVVLRLIDLGVRDVESFPFPTPPQKGKVRAAIEALTAMGAIGEDRTLTEVGRRMVPFPLSPALARIVVEASRRFPRVVEEVIIVGSFLSGKPPFLFPLDEEDAARDAQQALAHPLGDAMVAVRTFRAWQAARNKGAFCRDNYLDPDIMAFIDRAREQLSDIARNHGIEVGSGGAPEDVVRCVAAGFADRLLRRGRSGGYETPGGFRVAIHPGSTLFGSRHNFLVAAEIVISTRPYARSVSVVEAPWIAELRPDLAREWGIARRHGAGRPGRAAPVSLPEQIDLGGVLLPVVLKGGRPHVDIPLDVVDRLQRAEIGRLDPLAARWPARIVTPHGPMGGMALGRLVAVLPHLPLPQGDGPLPRDVPEGAMFTVEQHWPNLARLLPRLLQPTMSSGGGRRPGWLALAANGLGEYWFEVMHDFPAALQSSVVSLDAILSDLDRERAEPLEPLYNRLVEAFESVESAARAPERRGRQPS